MMSFTVCHERVSAIPRRGTLGSATKVGRCQPARGTVLRACLKLWSVTAVGLALPPASLQAEIAYVANANVSAYSIGAHGSLTSVAGSPFPAGSFPFAVAVDLSGRFVYVANAGSNNVSAYRLDDNGSLIPVPGSPFPVGNEPESVAFSP
jgi:DNA-binding beta-propeller fold protein YncE